MIYAIFRNGINTGYTSNIKKELELDLEALLIHPDNKEWIKNSKFEIKEIKK